MDVLTKRISIAVVPMPVADTEYSWTVPKNCTSFVMKTRGGSAFRLATEQSKVANSVDPYATIGAGAPYGVDNLQPDSAFVFYFASSAANEAMEIFIGQ